MKSPNQIIKSLQIKFLLLFVVGVIYSFATKANTILLPILSIETVEAKTENIANEIDLVKLKKFEKVLAQIQKLTVENKKITAAFFTLTLGMLGAHRIYLGTKPWVPAAYLFTFGGGFFILPAIDLIMILITKDISKYEQNDKIIMWLN